MFISVSWATAALTGILSLHIVQRLYFPYFWKDVFFVWSLIRCVVVLEFYKKRSNVVTVMDRFVQQAQRMPDKPFLVYDGRAHTYRQIDERSNRVARALQRHSSLKKGDTVAMLMTNEPDFLCVWFGLTKLGYAVAFLNTNIKSRSLLHCFQSCGAKLLVVGADLLDTLPDILPNLQEENISVWAMKQGVSLPGVHCLLDKIEDASCEPVPAELRSATSLKTVAHYIFTSGTTGLPKAAVISHLQSLKASWGLWLFGGTAQDIIYTALPLYHGAASLIGIGGTIELGATCVLKKKFSASQFWNDCRKYNVTIFQYIGELCRYLCNQPKAENEKNHKVHMAVGNGLRQDIWREFHSRFGEIRMCEIYGSTEGNLCFMNHIGKIGAVGRSNIFYKFLFNYELVKYNMERDEPERDEQGFCQPVQKGEMGLLLSRINSHSPFFGYAGSKQQTEKKIMRDVLKKGDAFFNTGDLLAEDQDDFISFKDRVGDTFRWKGENVATTEVTEILGLLDFIQEVNVYGVEVPGSEGRAGMASLIIKPGCVFDGKKLFENVMTYLPVYARPLFIRIQGCPSKIFGHELLLMAAYSMILNAKAYKLHYEPVPSLLESMELSGTFKQLKYGLVKSGFNPANISDPLYFLDYTEKSYVPLTDSIYDSIASGKQKL